MEKLNAFKLLIKWVWMCNEQQKGLLTQNDGFKLGLWQTRLLWRHGIWIAEGLLRKKASARNKEHKQKD